MVSIIALSSEIIRN